jgi:mono/diheme cytochrome c family protein
MRLHHHSRLAVTSILVCIAASLLAFAAPPQRAQISSPHQTATFYRDVLPILQQHCQSCHRSQGIGPMPLETYDQARRKAAEMIAKVASHKMPPWFADPRFGHFANDPTLSAQEIATLRAWVESGASPGDPRDAPPPLQWAAGWNIPQPDIVLKMPAAINISARGTIEYTYEIVPTGFTEDKWVRMSQVLPSSPQHVHHAVVYIRPPDSPWLRSAPIGIPFSASTLHDPKLVNDSHWTDSDMLLVYAPGSSPDNWPEGIAKMIPAGSDLVFQMHYTTNGKPATDQTSAGIIFAKQPPQQRVITLQLTNDSFLIPPGADDYPVEVHGTLPNDATLLSLFPHMHLRGKRFEYNIVHPDKTKETLLRVNYDFHWQLSYKLAEPRPLKAGTTLQAIGWFDNSPNNPHNPDPSKVVRWGDQTSDEMLVGFFDIAVPADIDKWRFFIRHPSQQK